MFLITSASRDGSIRLWKAPSLAEQVHMLTQTEVKRWSKKEAFEKTNASEKRMREKHIYHKEIETEVVNKVVSFYIGYVDWGRGIALGEYDADNEYFILNSEKFGETIP